MTNHILRLGALMVLIGSMIQPVSAMPVSDTLSASSPYDVIAAVNDLRAANGMPAYKTNNSLMSAAQSHSNYMAENQVISHTGAGGSTPKSRAVAAGYGGGATVFVSENIAMGNNMSAQDAVSIWQGDNLHLSTMLNRSYQDVGAGVATNGNVVYYTLVAGNISGSAPPNPPAQPTSTNLPPGSPTATFSNVDYIQSVILAMPLADGSIIHIVEPGQVLTIIANSYNIPLDQLLSQNNLTLDSIIFPGDRLLIQPAAQVSPTTTEVITSTSDATQTIAINTPSPVPSMTPTPRQVSPSITPTFTPQSSWQESIQADPLLMIIIAGIIVGITLVLLGSLLRRKG